MMYSPSLFYILLLIIAQSAIITAFIPRLKTKSTSSLVYLQGLEFPRNSDFSNANRLPGSRIELHANAVAKAVVAAPKETLLTKVKAILAPFLTKTARGPVALGLIVFALLAAYIRQLLWKPSRTYDKEANSVGREYDAWTTDGILEYYWGEHIHLGYYNEEERKAGYKKKNFIQAKFDFVDEMLKFSTVKTTPVKVLDVGCGIGGTSRYLAKKFGTDTQVTGITLSPQQQGRATQLAKDQGVSNAKFEIMDALDMKFPDNTFDLVWACESGEHMPDKKKYVEEMTRVLKPGGKIVIATWCQRDDTNKPFNGEERKILDFLYSEWTHPFFISIADYAKIMWGTKQLVNVDTDDWTDPTIASWRHSIWVGVYDPWIVLTKPHLWYKCLRDGITLERMHRAFESGLMQYGMMTATKAQPVAQE